jgi:hypothetical protein
MNLTPLLHVELPRRGDQADVAFLDQVDEGDAPVLILFCNTDHETQVGADELLDRVLVAIARTAPQLDLLLRGQQLVAADLPQVLIERTPLLSRAGETLEPRGGPPAPTLAVLCRAHPPLPLDFHPDHSRSRPALAMTYSTLARIRPGHAELPGRMGAPGFGTCNPSRAGIVPPSEASVGRAGNGIHRGGRGGRREPILSTDPRRRRRPDSVQSC